MTPSPPHNSLDRPVTALVQAGGRSARMRTSRGPSHKALVPILGVTLLKRSLLQLLSFGFRDIFVAVSAREQALAESVDDVSRELSGIRGTTIRRLVEERPYGTIGIASRLSTETEHLLVVNVDNLSSLNLRLLVRHHVDSGVSMTIATHLQPFRIPFGKLALDDGLVTGYFEKPEELVSISSGTYVLGPEALASIDPDVRTDIPELCVRLLDAGLRVGAYEHTDLWVDVNDAEAVRQAEALVRSHPDAFYASHGVKPTPRPQ